METANRFLNFYNGTETRAYDLLGCHRVGDGRYSFAVWAPNAKAVSIVGDFNNWLVNHDKMQLIDGIWQITLDARDGDCYKYAVTTQSGAVLYKADPYARYAEIRPKTASRIFDPSEDFLWTDEDWVKKQTKKDVYKGPVNIYEVHAGSWRRHYDGRLYSYRDLAKYLVPYVKKMGYTHVEFMPLSEHPFDGSWGYQVTGFYAPTSRYGTPDDLRYLVNAFHKAGIGVILDWVPAHFCKDAQGLMEFDGTCCYESADEFKKEHKSWGTRIFDYSRFEVQSFLVSNALYWLREFHFDGLRVDAVASMLYLDYDRKDGQWRPNKWGGKENLEAIDFLKKLSCKVFETCPYALFVAEESTAFPKVTHPTYTGGLGFNYKWNMGWMNDVLSYMKTDTLWRSEHHNQLTFSMCYAYSENYILPLSHDEVVHLKGSLIGKMFGEYDTKFAQLKALLGYQYAHPGKKLNFMGVELAQWNEWSESRELDWSLLTYPKHDSHRKFVQTLNKTYKKYKPLYQNDTSWEGFKWLLADDAKNSVLAFSRLDRKGNEVLVVINFSLYDYYKYGFYMDAGEYKLILNSDEPDFGGRGVQVADAFQTDAEGYAELTIPASSVTYYYKPAKK
ncbi:MAG: 1,4-alpha-glucan branching protein GlgB [Corallococcus sp.]|nr:1,4-alpha-glucan branching protein GlgB [Corallococcus sp.]MCM1359774.1 1,4-alpha-glucan branching protein GlgB [Corallococcus sp.]MCM1395700.1 1,4-alpha-glucan branching protein GlgB [Corallococcus sp.]